MSDDEHGGVLAALLNAWDRNNTILINLLRAIPEDALDLCPMASSPSIGALFAHMHYVRRVFVEEDAPESATPVPPGEWRAERDRNQIAQWLTESAHTVRTAVARRLYEGRAMALHYDHPILLLQHLIWHEGYHHGQIKLALKLARQPLADDAIGRGTWGVWMDKT